MASILFTAPRHVPVLDTAFYIRVSAGVWSIPIFAAHSGCGAYNPIQFLPKEYRDLYNVLYYAVRAFRLHKHFDLSHLQFSHLLGYGLHREHPVDFG